MANVDIKSYNEILGAMVRKIIADTPVNDVNTGSVLLTLLEAAASNDFENNVAILNVLELMNIDTIRNNDLDSYASNYGLTRSIAIKASGLVTISDSTIEERSTKLYSLKPAPIKGTNVIYVSNAAEWNPSGTLYIGRGTQNFEGPINYTSIVDNGTFYAINLTSSLQNDHLLTESVIDSQGTSDRFIPANTTIKIPSNNVSPEINYVTLRDAVIPAGQKTVSGISVVAVNAGTSGNAGINTINTFVSLPFTGAEVTNTTAFVNGRDAETDESFRDRIKAYSNSLARGTRQSILSAIYGLSDESEGKQVESANITEPTSAADASIVYIDDGNGFQPSYDGQSVDLLIASANGTEEFLQLSNYPLPRPQVINLIEDPYLISDSMELKVQVDGAEDSVIFYSSDFRNISQATIVEVATVINKKSTLFKCRFDDNKTRLLLYPINYKAETIKVISDGGSLDANTALKFPKTEMSHIKLYKNNVLLRESLKSATLTTSLFSAWDISTPGDLILSVDGTPDQDRSFALSDFGASTFASVTLQDWVRVFNYKFAGITASATTSGRLSITSNKEGADSSLKVVGGSYLYNMFSSQELESIGQNSDFILNRQNGNVQIKTDLSAGDTITAGSTDTKGYILSSQSIGGLFNLSVDASNRPSEMVIVADAKRVAPRLLELSISSTITISDQGSDKMRISSSSTSAFAPIQAGDYVYITSRGETRANPLVDPPGSGTWVDVANTGLFKVHAKGEHLDGTNSYIEVKNANMVAGGPYEVLDSLDIQAFYSDEYPQIWRASTLTTPSSATMKDIASSINSSIKGVEAKVFRTNYLKLTSSTENGGSIAIPISIGAASNMFSTAQGHRAGTEPHVASILPLKSNLTIFKKSEPETAWFNRHVFSEIKGSLASSSIPSIDGSGVYSETLTGTVTVDFLDTDEVTYNDSIVITSGQNKGQSRDVRSIISSTQVGTRNNTPRTLMDYSAGDEFSVVKGLDLSHEDNLVMILDNDPIAKAIDIPISRTGQINSGSQLSTFLPTNTAFSANDVDNEPGIDFGKVSVWGTLPTQTNTNFNDYNIWFKARNWYADNGAAMIIRAKDYGPVGERYAFSIDYPTQPDTEKTIVQIIEPSRVIFRYVFGSESEINFGALAGDEFIFTNMGSNIFRIKFPASCNINLVNINDLISIGVDSGFSAPNRGTFLILDKDDIAKTIDVYNPSGMASVTGTPKIHKVECVADTGDSLNGTYFILKAPNGDTVKFWYDNNDAGTIEPDIGITTRSWEINVATGDAAEVVATKTAAIIAADSAFATASNGSGTLSEITVTNANNGPTAPSSDGTPATGFIFSVVSSGTPNQYEVLNIVNNVKIYPMKDNDVATIVAEINANPMIEAVEHTSGILYKATKDIVGVSINQVAYGHNPIPSTDNSTNIYLKDATNWVSSFQNSNPNFQLKNPMILVGISPLYEMDTTVNVDNSVGEKFKLIPSTLNNLVHHMTHNALSQLNIVSKVSVAGGGDRVQIKSNLLGSDSAIEVVGGSANNASFKLIGNSEITEEYDTKFLALKIPASPNTLYKGQSVRLHNDHGVERLNRLTNTDRMDVSKAGTFCNYLYNPKTTNFNQFTKISIVDANSVDPVSYPEPGIVWRWIHDDSGVELRLVDLVAGTTSTPVMRNSVSALTASSEIHVMDIDPGSATDKLEFSIASSGVPDQADYIDFENSAGSSWAAWFSVDGDLTPPAVYTPGTAAVHGVQCVADTSDSLDGKFFTLNAGNGDTVKFWYDNNNSGTAEPAVGTTTRTKEINISTNDDSTQVANKTATAILSDTAFSSAVVTPGTAIPGSPAVHGVTCLPDIADSLNGSFFTLNAGNGDTVKFWYDNNDAGTAEPAFGTTTRSKEININTNDDEIQVANKTAAAILTDIAFSAANVSTGIVPGSGDPAIHTVQCVADVSNSLNGKYFILNATNGDTVKFWYDNNNAGTAEPAFGTTTRSKEINISTNDTAVQVATKTALVIATDVAFTSATNVGGTSSVVTVTNSINGVGSAGIDGSSVSTGVSILKTINSPDENPADGFGASVAIYGDYMVVGAPYDDGLTNNPALDATGEVYIFKKNQGGTDNWGHIKTLNSPNEDASDYFGNSVAIYGDYIVVGANNDYGSTDLIASAGEAYIFKKDEGGVDNWGLIKVLNSPSQSIADFFGHSVEIYGDYIAISAILDDGSTDNPALDNAGEVYIFKKNQGGTDNWGHIKTLNSEPFEVQYYQFGYSLSLYGDYLVVGEPNGGSPSSAGQASIYKKDEGGIDNWGRIKVLVSDNSDTADNFGGSVAIDGDYIVVGAWGDGGLADTSPATGEAYIYKKNYGGPDVWGMIRTLNSPNEDAGDIFGYSVAIHGDTVVVAAQSDWGAVDAISQAGEAYVFKKDQGGVDNWGLTNTINSTNEDIDDVFGSSVAVYGDYVVVGANGDSGSTDNPATLYDAGEAYIFKGGSTPSTSFTFSLIDPGLPDITATSINITNSQNGPAAQGTDGAVPTNFTFYLTTPGVSGSGTAALITVTNSQVGASPQGVDGAAPTTFAFSLITPGTPDGTTPISADHIVMVSILSTDTPNQIMAKLLSALNGDGISSDFNISQSDPATFNAIAEGNIINVFTQSGIPSTGWSLGNYCKGTGSDVVGGLPIIKVDPVLKYIDVANPDGIAMSPTSIGSNSIIIAGSPMIQWHLAHSSSTRYKLESLNYNDMFRLSRVDGDSPKFLSCGVAVDDILIVGADSFGSINSGQFRVLAVDEDSIVYQNSSGSEVLNYFKDFNDLNIEPTWTSNSNLITGVAGTFTNLSVGDWVKKTTDDDTHFVQVQSFNTLLASNATIVTLANAYQGGSGGSPSHAIDQTDPNSGIGKGIFLKNIRDVRVIEGDATRTNDVLFISENIDNNWFNLLNSGTFKILDVGTDPNSGRQYLKIDNNSGVQQQDVTPVINNAKFSITEGELNKFTSIREVYSTVIDPLNENRRIVFLAGGDRDYKWNQNNSSSISSIGKIGFSNDIVVGVDGYKYYTGLLRKVQRTIDGFDPDTLSFPGRRAVGSAIEVLPPIPVRIAISLDVTTQDGVNLSEISDEISSAVINYISSLGVGEDVILSDIIVRVKNIVGVEAVTFISPAPYNERIYIASGEKALIELNDINIT